MKKSNLLIAGFLGIASCSPSNNACESMWYRVDRQQERLFDLESQMKRLTKARNKNEIGKKKFRIVHDAVLDLQLNILYDLDSTYKKMATGGCYK